MHVYLRLLAVSPPWLVVGEHAQVGVAKRVGLTPFCDDFHAGLGRGSTAKPCRACVVASRKLDSMRVVLATPQCEPRGMLVTLTLKN
jgi:hypothetical protein